MEKLNNIELAQINGGISKTLLGGLAIGFVFVVSVIYGIIYPNKC